MKKQEAGFIISDSKLAKIGRRRFISGAVASGLGLGMLTPSLSFADDFSVWLNSMWPQARRAGVSRATFIRATRGLDPDPSIGRSASNQAEFVKPIWDYMDRAASDTRIHTGQQKLHEYANLLDAIEAIYGVPRQYILAIWGMESNFGSNQGSKSVIRSLATLGYSGRRRRFGRQQLVAALKILERGDISFDRMTGSWAGAMGHTQFIPTTYNAYAVDFDRDGRRDIWNSIPDALASTANYLRVSRWQPALPWGFEVVLPSRFDYRILDGDKARSMRTWSRYGVRRPGRGALGYSSVKARLLLPAGAHGPAFLITRNFKSILRYNNATAYALSVGYLGDRINGAAALAQEWPREDRPLARSERKELQSRLANAGFSPGPVDGVFGARTRRAVRAYQNHIGAPPDGHASYKLLEKLRD